VGSDGGDVMKIIIKPKSKPTEEELRNDLQHRFKIGTNMTDDLISMHTNDFLAMAKQVYGTQEERKINAGNEKAGTLIQFDCGCTAIVFDEMFLRDTKTNLFVLYHCGLKCNVYNPSVYQMSNYRDGNYKVIAYPDEWNIVVDGD